jgi:hypothetical protein
MVSSSESSVVNARPTRSPDRSRPVRKASVPPLLSRTGTKNVSATRITPSLTKNPFGVRPTMPRGLPAAQLPGGKA